MDLNFLDIIWQYILRGLKNTHPFDVTFSFMEKYFSQGDKALYEKMFTASLLRRIKERKKERELLM